MTKWFAGNTSRENLFFAILNLGFAVLGASIGNFWQPVINILVGALCGWAFYYSTKESDK